MRALYVNSCGHARVYWKLSAEFTTSSGVRQGCPLSPFLSNFVISILIEISLPVSETLGVEMLPGRSITDIKYADDIGLLGSDPSQLQTTVNNLNNSAARFGMCFVPTKCKILSRLAGEPIDVVDKFVYLVSYISSGGLAGGGLLVILPAAAATQYCEELKELEGSPAWVVGEVVQSDTKKAFLVESPTFIEVDHASIATRSSTNGQ
ncbi:hypothetical protein T265_02171 [Opisthorchis viverrini]|uniref:Reverse transcriptase domain-containing protein n=1 Tax=Opisthorchis viverrini TaxID=6198 RepID=A0A074ZX71_OPIVI|nr:hypothetical protein T265_02171 [Opisthorchis viverrini]KER31666.1 hypothetical protein T265_02171 [Opisthorchis viverrini]